VKCEFDNNVAMEDVLVTLSKQLQVNKKTHQAVSGHPADRKQHHQQLQQQYSIQHKELGEPQQ